MHHYLQQKALIQQTALLNGQACISGNGSVFFRYRLNISKTNKPEMSFLLL